jgi:hypothetical protein
MAGIDDLRERTEEENRISKETKGSDAPMYSTGWLPSKEYTLQKIKYC